MRTRTAILAALIVLPGCVFYFPEEEDDAPPPWPDAGWWPQPDAQWPGPDAGPGGPCDMPLACPTASTNRVTVCGRILDVATEQAVVSATLALTPYDALEYAGNPDGATPLQYDAVSYDECGRFRMTNIARPQLGFIALATDDLEGSGVDAYADAVVAFPVSSGQAYPRQRVYAISHTTDAQWSSQAAVSPSFVTSGAVLMIFLENGVPVPGVTVTEGGATEPANDYYFANANPWARTTIDPTMTATGGNGSALKLSSALVEHSGSDGSCEGVWNSALAASIPGVLFVAIRECYLGP
jgi:hypothetical protein